VSCVDATLIRSTIAATIPTIQPSMNARLFCRARSLNSIRITAMIGIGLIATPIASGRNSPIASPIRPPPHPFGLTA
jgi:hypothetical protein